MKIIPEFITASIKFWLSSSEAHASSVLTTTFAGHVLGLLPLILESPCNGQFSIWFLICIRILICNLYISGWNIFVHKEFCLQFPQKSLFYHCMGENWWIRVLWGICKVGELYEEILYVQWDVIYLCNNSYVSQKLNLHELTA